MHTNELQWRRTIPDKLMLSNEVHVWRVFLDSPECEIESLLGILSVNELEKANDHHNKRQR